MFSGAGCTVVGIDYSDAIDKIKLYERSFPNKLIARNINPSSQPSVLSTAVATLNQRAGAFALLIVIAQTIDPHTRCDGVDWRIYRMDSDRV